MNGRRQFLLMLTLALSGVADATSPPFGRLFTSPLERTILDRQRYQNPQAPVAAERIDGEVVCRSGRTRWLDGQPHYSPNRRPEVGAGNNRQP